MDILKNNNILDYKIVIHLIYDEYNLFYQRKYYLVNYKNGTQIVFLTSNEPEKDIDEKNEIDQEYTALKDFKHLVEDLDKSLVIDFFANSEYNSPPKYIYYNIEFIDKDFREMFLHHLTESLEGYSKTDLSEDVECKISYWQYYLENGKKLRNLLNGYR